MLKRSIFFVALVFLYRILSFLYVALERARHFSMLSGYLNGFSIDWTFTALLLLLSMNLFLRRRDGGHGTLIFIWMQILVVVWVSLRAILVIQFFLVVQVNNLDGLRRTLQQLL